MSDHAQDAIEGWLRDIESPDASLRFQAVEQLRESGAATAPVLRALERLALSDPDLEVRASALQSLSDPRFQKAHRDLAQASPTARQFMLREIALLEKDGLIAPEQAALIRGRYALPGADRPEVKPGSSEKPASPSLTQVLLSETSVRIALYLGGFFVVAAAFILAALIEVARLPILGATTLAFLGAAAGLARRLQPASFVLFAVGVLMIPIDAGVLVNQLQLSNRALDFYWAGIAALAGLLWAFGTNFYRSRLFSILAFLSLGLAAFLFTLAISDQPPAIFFALGLAGLAGLSAAERLAKRLNGNQAKSFFWPLFIVVQAWQAVALASSVIWLLFHWVDGSPLRGWQWLWIAALWGIGALFYAQSNQASARFGVRLPFPLPATACLMLAPLFALGAFNPSDQVILAAAWMWGALLIFAAEFLSAPQRQPEYEQPAALAYPPFLFGAGGALLLFGAFGEMLAGRSGLAIGYFLASALVFFVLARRRARWIFWLGSLACIYLAYLQVFNLPDLARRAVFPGLVLMAPTFLLLAFDLAGRKRSLGPTWTRPALILGLVSGLLDGWWTWMAGLDQPWSAVVVFLAYALFLLSYAWLDQRPYVAYFATGSLALALGYSLIAVQAKMWVIPLVALAALYDLSGLALRRLPGWMAWAKVLQVSGLVLAAIVALTAPLERGPAAVLGVSVAATLFAVEGLRLRNVWLGFPACVFYFVAYALALLELDLRQPQLYTIAAALLGILMHYLLLRTRNPAAALATGLLAQLILLSTTYIQMVSSEDFQFFFMIFFQALALEIYGLVARSRSFVLLPIVFLVLSVVTVAFTVLSGLPTVLIIGCTGLLLLGLGILALLLRERLTRAADRWVGRLDNW